MASGCSHRLRIEKDLPKYEIFDSQIVTISLASVHSAGLDITESIHNYSKYDFTDPVLKDACPANSLVFPEGQLLDLVAHELAGRGEQLLIVL